MNRRRFTCLSASAMGLALMSNACGLLGVGAAKVQYIGVLAPDDGTGPRWDAFRARLRDLGWIEGTNLITKLLAANGMARLDELVGDLVNLGVDVLVTGGTEAALAARRATKTIPIVVTVLNDPVGSGLVSSYGHPGTNVTGLSQLAPELTPKWLELVAEIVPGVTHLAVLGNGANPSHGTLFDQARAAAPSDLEVRFLDARDPGELAAVFDMAAAWPAHAFLILPDFVFYASRNQLARLALQRRLPGLYPTPEYTEAGGLMSYGPDQVDLFRRAAGYVDKIFKGSRPGDLPIEAPTTFDFAVNLKTAQALGISVPPDVARQVTEWIQ
jgi:putative ABC transport system substrate-binding protein